MRTKGHFDPGEKGLSPLRDAGISPSSNRKGWVSLASAPQSWEASEPGGALRCVSLASGHRHQHGESKGWGCWEEEIKTGGGGGGRAACGPTDMHALHCCHCWHSLRHIYWLVLWEVQRRLGHRSCPRAAWQSSRGDSVHAGSTRSGLGFPKMSLTRRMKSAGLRKRWRKPSGHWHQAGEEGRGVRGCWGGTQGTWMGSGYWEWGKGKQLT